MEQPQPLLEGARPRGPSKPAKPAGGTPAASSSDERLFRELTDRFTVLAEACARFSQEVYRRAGTPPEADVEATTRRNLRIARAVFGKWTLEILAVTYFHKSVGFPELKKALGRISSPVLTMKLRQLEKTGLLERSVATKEPPETRYSLTHKGLMIARLGEPVFLYVRLADGWRRPVRAEGLPGEPDDAPSPAAADA